MIGELSQYLTIGAEEYEIRSDYRDVLQIFEAFSDQDLEQWEKWIVAIYLLLKPFTCSDDVFDAIENGFDFAESTKQISWFISAGQPEKQLLEKPTYDWKKDEQIIFSAINKVAGKETRELEYLHWWTFLGYFNEVGEGTFSFIVGIRNKMNKNKKLEKHEQEYLNNNKESVTLKRCETKEELEEKERQRKVWENLV